MKGQWRGSFHGYSSGEATLEIDELDQHYSGRACIFETRNDHFVYVIEFKTGNKQTTQQLDLPIQIQKIAETRPILRSELAKLLPNVTIPDRVQLTLKVTKAGLRVNGITYNGTQVVGSLTAVLSAGSADKKSRIGADRKITTWKKFKSMVGDLPPSRYIFRGQAVPNRLRTSFHRTNRRDLTRFEREDIPMLHGVVTAQTKHYFNLQDNIQNAAFWNLLQHHGYPTPLLDWTQSPYVAAYFAFREKLSSKEEQGRSVRIFVFDRTEWLNDYRQIYTVSNVMPHFSLLDPIALENPRALPQQAVCSVTTVDDVEGYLQLAGKAKNKTYLRVIELPYSQRSMVLADLRLMGVTAGTLFPGIDGACEQMRMRNFAT